MPFLTCIFINTSRSTSKYVYAHGIIFSTVLIMTFMTTTLVSLLGQLIGFNFYMIGKEYRYLWHTYIAHGTWLWQLTTNDALEIRLFFYWTVCFYYINFYSLLFLFLWKAPSLSSSFFVLPCLYSLQRVRNSWYLKQKGCLKC